MINIGIENNDPIVLELLDELCVDANTVEAGSLSVSVYNAASVVVSFRVVQFMHRDDFQPYMDRLIAREAQS